MPHLIHLHILASGSKGNAAIVEGPEGSVLIDCGISRKRLYERAHELGVDMGNVCALFLTHEHSDHIAGLSVFAKQFDGKLYTTAATARSKKSLSQLPFSYIRASDELTVAGMHVRTFPTSHDVSDPFGLRFSIIRDGSLVDSLGWCTDTGVLTDQAREALSGCRILAIESNHDLRMLESGPYPLNLKMRVGGRSGHLSNDQCADALPSLITSNTHAVVALHLSEKNNRPSTCVRTLAKAIDAVKTNDVFTEAQTVDGSLTICAAGQHKPVSIW